MGATSKQGEEHRDESVFFPSAAEKLPAVSSFFLASGGGGGSLLRPQLLRDFLFASYGYLSLSPSLSAVLYGRGLRGKREKRKPAFSEENATKSTSSSSRSRGFRRGSSSRTRRCERVSPSHRPLSTSSTKPNATAIPFANAQLGGGNRGGGGGGGG
jgi:hypothetical protein